MNQVPHPAKVPVPRTSSLTLDSPCLVFPSHITPVPHVLTELIYTSFTTHSLTDWLHHSCISLTTPSHTFLPTLPHTHTHYSRTKIPHPQHPMHFGWAASPPCDLAHPHHPIVTTWRDTRVQEAELHPVSGTPPLWTPWRGRGSHDHKVVTPTLCLTREPYRDV